MIAWAEGSNALSHLLHDPDAFMAQNASGRTGRHIAFQDVQIGAANRRLGDPYDGVGGGPDFWHWPVFHSFAAGTEIDKNFHVILQCEFVSRANYGPGDSALN